MCVGAGDTVWGYLLGLSCRSFCSPCVLVVSTLSSGYVRAPLPYRLVNAGLFDYKKKKKKKIQILRFQLENQRMTQVNHQTTQTMNQTTRMTVSQDGLEIDGQL